MQGLILHNELNKNKFKFEKVLNNMIGNNRPCQENWQSSGKIKKKRKKTGFKRANLEGP